MSAGIIILVIGVGRSGTSALTRVLSLCGLTLPDKLLGAAEFNLKGTWEPIDALELNHSFMFKHGTEMFDPEMYFEDREIDDGVNEEYVEAIRSLLRSSQSGQLLIKEPAISELMDFWMTAASREGCDVRIVVAFRHPQEVYASWVSFFKEMIPVSQEMAHALWLKRNLLAERKTRAYKRAFVHHADLMGDWRVQVDALSNALSIDLDPNVPAIEDFLTASLYRQRDSGPVLEVFGEGWLGLVYREFMAAAGGGQVDTAALDEIYKKYRTNERTFRLARTGFDEYFKFVRKSRAEENRPALPTFMRGRDFI